MPPPAPEPDPKPGLLRRLRAELRRHAIGYGVLAAFAVIGPVLVHLIFPGVSPVLGLIGGLAFGLYAALSAVPDRFYE